MTARVARLIGHGPVGVWERAAGVCGSVLAVVPTRGVRQLEANLSRLGPVDPGLIRRNMAAYMRSFAASFALESLEGHRLDYGCCAVGEWERLRADVSRGPVVVALTHSGQWDLAAAWVARNLAGVVTVAEDLPDPDLAEAFTTLRRRLGVDVVLARPGEHPFEALLERVRDREAILALLADRDITGRGVEVTLGGHRLLVAAGPAAAAQRLSAPLYPVHLRSRRLGKAGRSLLKRRYGLTVDVCAPVDAPRMGVEAATQAWVAALAPKLHTYPSEWHMLQRVFVDDLDPERLARARERAGRAAT
ncbi:MAG: phosphatidylinositol mannoside acyltransferase [Actinomycetaceae bacterium]|nr:phosphatidylinositol mannoside acyltransferase [Actinomycetaceae bacterium]